MRALLLHSKYRTDYRPCGVYDSYFVVGSHYFVPAGGHQHLEATEDAHFLDLPRQSLPGIHLTHCILRDQLGEAVKLGILYVLEVAHVALT